MKKIFITALLGSVGWLAHAQGRVGINTNTPRAGLDVNHNDGFVATGSTGVGNVDDLPTGNGTRMMWIPRKAAFRAGQARGDSWNVNNIGNFSIAFGWGTLASGDYALAAGYQAKAEGISSFAFGPENLASAHNATAIGAQCIASALRATAMGSQTEARGYAAAAIGQMTRALGDYSIALGHTTIASGRNSTAFGNETVATGTNATAMGRRTVASGNTATALGNETFAIGENSLSTGFATYANGNFSTAMGTRVTASLKTGAFVIGDASPVSQNTGSSADNKFTARFANGYLLYTSANLGSFTALPPNGNAWTSQSDSTKKTGFLAANGEVFLEKLRGLRLGSWHYKNQDSRTMRHYGPMAQEFFAAYGRDGRGTIGTDTTLGTADVDGVAFILLQALEKRTAELQTRLAAAEAQLVALRAGKNAARVTRTVPPHARRATPPRPRALARTEKQRWYDDDGPVVRELR